MKEKKYFEDRFKRLDKVSKKNLSIPNIQLSFKIAQKQSILEGGLQFVIILTNSSSDDIKINNPLDYLQIIIQDDEGWPVNLPLGSPPRALINARGPVEIVRPFKVESIENSLGEFNLLEMVNDEEILLKALTTYHFLIRIDKVMDSDKNNRMVRTDKTKSIVKGKYKINLNLSILLTENKGIFTQSESGYVEVELY